MPRRALFPFIAILVVAASCAEPTAPNAVRPGSRRVQDVDPHPEDPLGIFIPNVNPSSCFRDVNYNIAVDHDFDWLDDNCEVELARAFAPEFNFAMDEQCPGREPAWAVNYFPDGSGNGIVRIAYMPAYYDDCGTFPQDSHHGDSEFTMVEVLYYPSLGHWVFQQMWLSAHYGPGGPWDRSRWVSYYSTEFPDHPGGYPRIFVSALKHANYATYSMCVGVSWEGGCGNQNPQRLSIDATRNAGSRHADVMGCVFSTGQNVGSGRTECFFTDKAFNGWYAGSGGQTAYRKLLVSDKFEYDAALGRWSAGPHPPGWTPPYYAYISGQSTVKSGNLCHYFVNTNLTPNTIEWFVDGQLVGTDADLWYAFSQSAILSVLVTQGSDNKNDAMGIVISPSAPACGTEW
jgi:hypothetical protein